MKHTYCVVVSLSHSIKPIDLEKKIRGMNAKEFYLPLW